MGDWLTTIEQAIAALPDAPDRERYVEPFRHGTMRLGLYSPSWADGQQPHEQDEIYLIVRGSGDLIKNGDRRRFGPGDVLFVEAGAEHRFVDFSSDFTAWVVFWGPAGGEREEAA